MGDPIPIALAFERESAHEHASAGPHDPGGRARLNAEVMTLYDAHGASLLRYACTICRSADAARDGLQETFVRYLMARQGGAEIGNPRAWLFRVLHNYLVDAGTQPAAEVHLEQIEHRADPRDWHAHMTSQRLGAQLSQLLSPRELECLMLRLEGLTYDEIAMALNLQSGTIGALLYRVTRKARNLLGVGRASA